MTCEGDVLVQFTDEELLLLGGEHPVVDSPYLSTLGPEQRRLAAQVAYRSLCSHGAIAVDGGVGLELPESYVTMFQLRSAATAALVVSKATPDTGVMRYYHLGGETVALEDVSDAGAHAFRMLPRAALADSLRAFCRVDGAADGVGVPVTLDESCFAGGESADELWGEGLAQFDATVWRRDATGAEPAPVLGFLLGSTGSWSIRRKASVDGPATVHLTPTGATEPADTILACLLGEEGIDAATPEWHLMRA